MKLRHPKSNLSQFKEVSAPKRTFGSKLTQWIYLTVLLFLLAYIIYYIAYKIFYFDQRGLVVVNHVIIASKRGGRILKVPVVVGSHVKKGELLLLLDAPDICRQGASNKTIRELKIKNAFDREKIRALVERRNIKKNELRQMQYQQSMELFAGNHARIQSLQDILLTLGGNINGLRHGLKIRTAEIKTLFANKMSDAACQNEVIRAPSDGTIIAVQHKVFEVLQRTEPVMDFIKDGAPVYIHAVFNNKFYNALSLGKEVQIRFPNGDLGKGKIIEVKSTSVPFAMNENQKYLPQRTRLLAIIKPLEKKESDLWKLFIEQEVEVRGWR